MRLSDYILDLGRVVAYYPNLKKITGSTTSSILLCQLLYWSDKTKDSKGWIYKDSYELEEETGLSYNEQKTARENLIELNLIEEKYKRLDHKIEFRVNLSQLNDLWEQANPKYIPPEPEKAPLPELNRALTLKDFQDLALHPENEEAHKKGDLVDGTAYFAKSKGMIKEVVKNEIRDKIENLLHINTDTPKWDKFIDYAYQRQVHSGELVEQWIAWALKNGFNPIYWTPEKCKTTYPQAFVEDTSNKPREDFVEKLPEQKEEEYAPMPEELKKKKKLY
jgi:hypothetical protein